MKCGNTYLIMAFDKLVQVNPSHALTLLNDQNLSFPTFFLLIPKILEHNLEESLSSKNQFALEFTTKKSSNSIKQPYLKWMLLSSINQGLDSEEFQKVIDRVIIQLIVVLNEQSFLPLVVNIIFARNRKNHCIYDLCWAIFQSNTVYTLPLIANYLTSTQIEDTKLAYKLLNFKPDRQPKSKMQQYQNFYKWFHENKKFLYFNNETMQETCQPKYWRVNLSSKYLCKSTQQNSLSNAEKEQEKVFQNLDRKTQKLLSKYSYQTYIKDKKVWNDWMNSSISMQIETCKKALGDRS
jgi:hypothetical protein